MHETSDLAQTPLTPVLVRMLQGRVGSTRLMDLLGSSSAVAFDRVYPYENSYLTYLVRLLKQPASSTGAPWTMNDMRYGEGATAGPLPFRPISLDLGNFATQGLAALWRVFCQSIRDTTTEQVVLYAEKYWGSVTPVIEAGLSPIVIDLVRDPRDVVVSIREFNARQGQRLFGRPGVADDGAHLRHVVGGMGFRLREMDEQLPVIRKLVRYEDMVADTAGQAALLSSLLTVDLDPYSTLLDRAQVAQHMTSPSAEYSVGRWRTELSPHDIAFIERRLGSHMIKFGYDLSSAP